MAWASLDLTRCARGPAGPWHEEQRMDATRFLVVIADDFGIGPETSRGILELAARGIVTGTVLLTNSPYAADAVRQLRRSGVPLDLGWHPCLTMDPPVAGAGRVRSLVGPDGCLWPLRQFVPRLLLGRLCPQEIEIELNAQYDRFLELAGHPPSVVNAHQHVSLFPPVGRILRTLLARRGPLPYMRRIREPWALLRSIPGARLKRGVLNALGRLESWGLDRLGFAGNDTLAGITDPAWVKDEAFFTRWLGRVSGRVAELACHPGHRDDTVAGRDCPAGHALIERRIDELRLLGRPEFLAACRAAGFVRVAPSRLPSPPARGLSHAA
jgi:predicted glycoside hydrolase/deacetylase ChbG (UPF0249 family)